jgi:hypothetical protein
MLNAKLEMSSGSRGAGYNVLYMHIIGGSRILIGQLCMP